MESEKTSQAKHSGEKGTAAAAIPVESRVLLFGPGFGSRHPDPSGCDVTPLALP